VNLVSFALKTKHRLLLGTGALYFNSFPVYQKRSFSFLACRRFFHFTKRNEMSFAGNPSQK
jgi:hypothetical protein